MSRQVHVSDSAVLPSMMEIIVAPQAEDTRVKMSVQYRFMSRLGVISRAFEYLVMNHMLKSVLGQNLTQLDRYLQEKSESSAYQKSYLIQ
jgi:hypothetical protein